MNEERHRLESAETPMSVGQFNSSFLATDCRSSCTVDLLCNLTTNQSLPFAEHVIARSSICVAPVRHSTPEDKPNQVIQSN